ncbi:uncharacterized protein SPSC_06576 [Sporisorium scitamineum]|uniref:Reverse transcriptase domain-containing protein n=1 Tax=Sporisorium scitamineum TaxID=49012 RepID=A0A140KNK7_9BASI|nr:uncharacterized protein SPSC_06576 [Sporisorium scitamineum]
MCRLVCSLVGMVPKPRSTKLHTIHHLSHLQLPVRGQLPSINNRITTHFTTICYVSIAPILAYAHDHPGCHLWKSDLMDAFHHIVMATSDARLLGLTFNSCFYMEMGLTFSGHSTPWLFNLFAKALHWIVQSTTNHPVKHYLDNFFGATPALTPTNHHPLHALALTCQALGLQLAPSKTLWGQTQLKILSIEVNTICQTVSITKKQHDHILDAINHLLSHHSARLLDWQCIAGLLQFVTQVVPHGKAFFWHLYDASKVAHHHPLPLHHILCPAVAKLKWWCATLTAWPGHLLLQLSPLVVEYVWTDALKHGYSAHVGPMEMLSAVWAKEVLWQHHAKDICFHEALAILDTLHVFSAQWTGPCHVILHVDNTNVEYGLWSGCSRNPLTQTLLHKIFGLFPSCTPPPFPGKTQSNPSQSFITATGCLPNAATFIWQGLAESSRQHSHGVPGCYSTFIARQFSHNATAFPTCDLYLTKWACNMT